jgi:hypothetical protein
MSGQVRRFSRFAVIDWSGQNVARPKGIAIALAGRGDACPQLVAPPDGRWSRMAVIDWLRDNARADLLIGLDLSPGLPFADRQGYFPGWADAPREAKSLWQMVEAMSANCRHLSANGFLAHPTVREHFFQQAHRGVHYAPANGRLRRCEERQREMKLLPSSCMKLIGANQVGKSSLTGMRVLHRVSDAIPVWPFDPVPDSGATIVEIYTTIAALAAGRPANRSKMRSWEELDAALVHADIGSQPTGMRGPVADHASDAILTAAWLRRMADHAALWEPEGLAEVADTEGWTFGAI